MTITIYDYANKPMECELSRSFEEVEEMIIEVFTGDEILTVKYIDGFFEDFDSSTERLMDYFDGRYVIFDKYTDLYKNEEWLSSIDSYDRLNVAYGGITF